MLTKTLVSINLSKHRISVLHSSNKPITMETVLSQRGKEKFSHNGYLYIFDRISKTDSSLMFWKCDQLGRCKVRIHTGFGNVVKILNTHTHDSSPIQVQVERTTTQK